MTRSSHEHNEHSFSNTVQQKTLLIESRQIHKNNRLLCLMLVHTFVIVNVYHDEVEAVQIFTGKLFAIIRPFCTARKKDRDWPD